MNPNKSPLARNESFFRCNLLWILPINLFNCNSCNSSKWNVTKFFLPRFRSTEEQDPLLGYTHRKESLFIWTLRAQYDCASLFKRKTQLSSFTHSSHFVLEQPSPVAPTKVRKSTKIIFFIFILYTTLTIKVKNEVGQPNSPV